MQLAGARAPTWNLLAVSQLMHTQCCRSVCLGAQLSIGASGKLQLQLGSGGKDGDAPAYPVQEMLLPGFTADAAGRFQVGAPGRSFQCIRRPVVSALDAASRFFVQALEPVGGIHS